MPTGRSALISRMACSIFRPRVRISPPSRIAMAIPMAGFPLTRNIGCGGIRIGAVNLGDVAQSDQAPIRHEIHRQDILLGFECARYAQHELFVAGLQSPGWADDVLRR